MKLPFKKLRFIFLILLISLFCFTTITYAVNNSSNIKIGRVIYSPAMSTGSTAPPVACNIASSGPDGTSLSISFASGKRAGKTAFINLDFNLSADDYSSLMAGDTIDFQQTGNITSLIGQKVFLIFSEESTKKSKTKLISVSEGLPLETNNTYSAMGTVKILNKRADGCLDVSFNAVAQNPIVNKTTAIINPSRNCVEKITSEKLRTVPSVSISGNLYPEKFSGNIHSSTIMLCNAPNIPGTETSSGSIDIPDFGNSSGFTIPDFGSSSGFIIPEFPDENSNSET